jgi:hypothetical protein
MRELARNGKLFFDEDILFGVNHSWSTDYYVGLLGWAIGRKEPLDSVAISIAGGPVQTVKFIPRPDLAEVCLQYHTDTNCGFQLLFPRPMKHELTIYATTSAGRLERTVKIPGLQPRPAANFTLAGNLFAEFQAHVNGNHLSVLEIGSRVVSPGSASKRPLFHGASEYVGFDYYDDANTDVVGDAHRLSSYFSGRKFDTVFSISVLEHIAMPWLVAIEINKLLNTGGLTFHNTPTAVPLHERPWDFWRYTEESLKVLFSPPHGFEVLKTGYTTPVRIYPDAVMNGPHGLMPLHPTFGGVAILARKSNTADAERFCWDATTEAVLGSESHYPAPTDRDSMEQA